MVSNSNTPAMRQYLQAKEAHPDALLFFRMGDFYELFFEDAVDASRMLELTLTSRNKNSDQPVPMAGVPHHAAKGYIQRLVAAGRKVAICEQIEDPKLAKGVVKRAVTHVVTPGVNLEEDALESGLPNYLAALTEDLSGFHFVYADVSTGEYRGTTFPSVQAAQNELRRIQPRELVVTQHFATRHGLTGQDGINVSVVSPDIPQEEGFEGACGLLTQYLARMNPAALKVLGQPEHYDYRETMELEESTLLNLEILQTLMTGKRKGSLLGLMDETCTAMGARLLRRWLQAPLLSLSAIRHRQDMVAGFVEGGIERGEIRDALAGVYDLERLSGRLLSGMASPKDLGALRGSLSRLPGIIQLLKESEAKSLRGFKDRIDPHPSLLADLQATLSEEPGLSLSDGGIIREGVSIELDELRHLSRDGKSWLLRYEAAERDETGISSLKVRYNKVFGYYIEVSKANVHLVPDHYVRKQTLVNAERYFTPELKEYEDKILSAEDKILALETALFEALRERSLAHATGVASTAERIAELDVFAGLAELAQTRNYCRPELNRSRNIEIRNGRHPVIESMLEEGLFVPNDITLRNEDQNFLLITGPNMAGKSTVMRQVALVTLMAQVGSFVPAEQATLGIVDKIFTRVGASDNLSRGQSTFMVEMNETATILEKATDRSLVILDEVGRGTSTYDGLSIAWAVVEHIHNQIRARTLFATHYHELVELEETLPRLKNFHIAVKEHQENIIFLHQLRKGGTNRSYGIQVGRLAGIPQTVISRAKTLLRELETKKPGRQVAGESPKAPPVFKPAQFSLFETGKSATLSQLRQRLRDLRPDGMTPLEALQCLYELKELEQEES